MGLILASRSPQRRAILEQLGIAFEVVDVDVEELTDGPAVEIARANALRKAQAGAAARPGETSWGSTRSSASTARSSASRARRRPPKRR